VQLLFHDTGSNSYDERGIIQCALNIRFKKVNLFDKIHIHLFFRTLFDFDEYGLGDGKMQDDRK
jgi:hypothetical protein